MKRIFQISNAVALMTTVIINYLSNTGIFNNETMATISAKYQNLFTPAGYAFSIWGLIYLGVFGFVIYYGPFSKETTHKNQVIEKVGWWFVISCIANSFWVIAWLYEYTFITILLMGLLFVSLLKIILNTEDDLVKSSFQTSLFLKIPFYIYSGWISVALIANVAAYLKKMDWNGFGISETTWTVLLFCIATIIHLFMIWKRNMPAFGMVAVWALIAIAVANKTVNDTVYLSAIIFAIFIFTNVALRFFGLKKREFYEK